MRAQLGQLVVYARATETRPNAIAVPCFAIAVPNQMPLPLFEDCNTEQEADMASKRSLYTNDQRESAANDCRTQSLLIEHPLAADIERSLDCEDQYTFIV